MGYIEDKIKILELICAELLPFEVCPESQEIILEESDFEKVGFSFNSAMLIIKDIFSIDSINKFKSFRNENGKWVINLSVTSDLESYTKNLKYPEIEYVDGASLSDGKPTTSSNSSKISIIIDNKIGIYAENNPESCYKIKSNSKRMKMISQLFLKDKVTLSELKKESNQPATLIMKEIKQINLNFRQKLNMAYDLIIHIPTGGYSLNKDRFDIKPL